MYKGELVILTICARSGSKSIPGKNIKKILGKPLLAYTINQAKLLSWVDRIVLSTDDIKIKKVAENLGIEVPFLRSKRLASDSAGKVPAIIDAVNRAEKIFGEKYNVVIDLDPTSPLRNSGDINSVINILVNTKGLKSVFSVCEAYKNPYFNMIEVNKNGYASLSKKNNKPITRRQDAPRVYEMNASIYGIWKNVLFRERTFLTNRTHAYVMPRERSIDIDNPIDFEFVEFLMRKRGK